jgi:hypothetical protein
MTKVIYPALRRITTDSGILSFFIPVELRGLDSTESGKYYCVSVSRPRKPRSTGPHSQNHRLNGFISQFCQSTGNDKEDIKLYVKRKAMRRGLPMLTNEKGDIVYSKVDGEPLPISEADMSSEECSWCIAEIEQLAAECGVHLVEE